MRAVLVLVVLALLAGAQSEHVSLRGGRALRESGCGSEKSSSIRDCWMYPPYLGEEDDFDKAWDAYSDDDAGEDGDDDDAVENKNKDTNKGFEDLPTLGSSYKYPEIEISDSKVQPMTAEEVKARGCLLEPPYIYVTFHSDKNIAKYSRDGCYLSDMVLQQDVPLGKQGRVELRSVLEGPYWDHNTNTAIKDALYVANGAKHGPQVLVYGQCDVRGQRKLVQIVTGKALGRKMFKQNKKRMEKAEEAHKSPSSVYHYKANVGANHAYGLALAPPPDMSLYSNSNNNSASASHTDDSGSGSSSTSTSNGHIGNDQVQQSFVLRPGQNGQLFASFQHTDAVLWFDYGSMQELGLPNSLLTPDALDKPYYPGTFHQFGYPLGGRVNPQISPDPGSAGGGVRAAEGVRGMEVVYPSSAASANPSLNAAMAAPPRRLWVANENLRGIIILDIITGVAQDFVHVVNPIALFQHRPHRWGVEIEYPGENISNGLVYVSSKRKHGQGRVVAIHPDTLQVVREFHSPGMTHPTGILVHGHTLYVAEQALGAMLKFDTRDGKFLGKVIRKFPAAVEGIAFTSC